MFDNIGGKLKGLAVFIFVLEAIISGLLGLVLVSGGGQMALVGLLVIVGGVVIAYVGSFRLYGYGQLIENTDTIIRQLKKIEDRGEPASPGTAPKTSVQPVASTVPVTPKVGRKTEPEATQFTGPRPPSGMIVCPNCGVEQKSDRTVCWRCATKFVFEGESAPQTETPAEGEVRIRCGTCGKEYFGPRGANVACPYCKSTLKIFD